MKPGFTIHYGQLDDVVAFLRVADLQSFRGAAAELGVSPSAVSQIVRNLEARVGVALLTRTTRKVGLTEAGQRFVEQARPAVEGLQGAFEMAHALGERPQGLLRLAMPRAAAAFFLDAIVEKFCRDYPEVQIEIHCDEHRTNIVGEGFDAGFRLGELIEEDMVAVRLTPSFCWAVVGAPSYFAKHGRPQQPEDLAQHACIGFRRTPRAAVYRWEFVRGNRNFDVPISGPMIVNDTALNLTLATKGLGLAYTGEPLAAPQILNGKLETVLDDFMPESPGLFLYYPSRKQALPKLRAFIDFARAHLQITEALPGMRKR